MSEHTPTLDEVRDCYATGAPCGEGLRQRLERKFRDDYAEFDRWLTRERAQAKAEALREAADELASYATGRDSPYEMAGRDIIAKLRDRAAKLEGK